MESVPSRGLEVVDSLYEFLGYSLCQSLDQVLRSFWIPLIVAFGGIIYAVVRASERGEPKALVGYLLCLVLMVWLLAPTPLLFGKPYAHTTTPGQGTRIRATFPLVFGSK